MLNTKKPSYVRGLTLVVLTVGLSASPAPVPAQNALTPVRQTPNQSGNGGALPIGGISSESNQAPIGQMPFGQVPSGQVPLDPASNASDLTDDPSATASTTAELLARINRSDADINAISVVSADRLCAVGNCGLILLSENAGRSWRESPSPTVMNLHDVAFVNEMVGFAVGGTVGAYTSTSYGVLLATYDGGRRWSIAADDIPRLTGLQLRGSQGIAWGDFDPRHRSGLFRLSLPSTQNGSQPVLQSVNGEINSVTAAGLDLQGNLLAYDRLGRSLSHPRAAAAPPINTSICSIVNTGHSWLACTTDGAILGRAGNSSWQPVLQPASLTQKALSRRWRCIAQLGERIWVAGTPGNAIAHSPDGGQSWELRATGHSLPIHDIAFLDEARGWAVGPLGTIMATRDGGQNWYVQRQANKRVAVLAIGGNAGSLPWAPLIAAAWESQRATRGLVLQDSSRLQQAGFVPTENEQLIALSATTGCTINNQTSNDPSTNNPSHSWTGVIETAIRTWRPDVILIGSDETDHSAPSADLEQIVLSAITSAQQPMNENASVDQLPAWKVRKVVSACQPKLAQYSEQSQRVLNGFRLAIWDWMQSLPPATQRLHAHAHLKTLFRSTQNQLAEESFLGGVGLSPETLRPIKPQELGNYQLVMGRVHRERSIERLVQLQATHDEWTRSFRFLMQSIPAEEKKSVLLDLATRLRTSGRPSRQQHALDRLIEIAASTDAAASGMHQQLMLSASDEWAAWLKQSGATESGAAQRLASSSSDAPPVVRTAKVWEGSPFESATPATMTSPSSPGAVTAASATTPVPQSDLVGHRSQQFFTLLSRYSRLSPALAARPDVRFMAHRMAREVARTSTESYERLQALIEMQQLIGWPQAAQQEVLVETEAWDSLRWRATAARAQQRPLLDGQLDEAFWTDGQSMQLLDRDKQNGTSVAWGFDNRYLYIGIRCPKPAGSSAVPLQRVRTYDSDLSGLDHVTLMLDTDRDYSTCVELGVSEDGRTYDRCCGHPEFNPKWHVSVASEHDQWTAELAIELDYLTTREQLSGHAWAVTMARSGPGISPETWGHLAPPEILLEGSGLLRFQESE